MKKIIYIFKNGLLQNIVIGIYFITLLVECYLQFYRYYSLRIYTRPPLMILLFMVFFQQFISRNHLYILGAMICACVADYLIITYYVLYQWTGVGLYALSSILLALQFFQLEYFTFKTSKLALFISLMGLIIYIATKEYFASTHDLLLSKKPFTYAYAASLAVLCTAVLNIYFNNKQFNFKFAITAFLLLLIANISFDCSIYIFHRKQTWPDSLCGFCYGLSYFLMIRGLLRAKDKIMGNEYFQSI